MTLMELGAEYRKSADIVKAQLVDLRLKKKTETDQSKLFDIEYRIKVLTPVLTELNKTAERCTNYYGNDKQISVKCNGNGMECDSRGNRRKRSCTGNRERIYGEIADDNAKRVNRETARNREVCSSGRYELHADSEIAQRFKKYSL